MPRTARASAAGSCDHALNRGNARATVFHKDRDYQAVLEMMAEAESAAIRESIRRDRPSGAESWVRTTAGVLGPESSLRGPGRPRAGRLQEGPNNIPD